MSCTEMMKEMEHKQMIKEKAYNDAFRLYRRFETEVNKEYLSDYIRYLCNKLSELRGEIE